MYDYIKADLGPLTLIERFQEESFLTIHRSVGNNGCIAFETKGSPYPERLTWDATTPFSFGTEPDEPNVWHTLCGLMLYTSDGLGNQIYSNYNLVWQYRIRNVLKNNRDQICSYLLTHRIIKIHATNPLDVTTLESDNFSMPVGSITNNYTPCTGGATALVTEYNNVNYFGFGYGFGVTNNGASPPKNMGTVNIACVPYTWLTRNGYTVNIVEIDDMNELDPDYPSKPGGGGGNHDRTSDPIAIPGLPTIGAQSLGVVTMYKLTSAEMGVFGQEMTASDLWEAVKLLFQNPQDYIIGCTLLPFTPPGDSVWYPKIGAYTFNHSYLIISSQFVEVDCGTLTIDEYWGSCFDYEPYTQITIWLPYIGYRAVPVDEIMKKSIYVKYHIDCLSGDCVAFVGISSIGPEGPDIEKVLGQFSGNCAVQMPYGSVTFDQILSSGISMLSGAGVFAATGGNGGGDVMANSAMSMIAGVKGEVQQGGTIGSSGGYMGVQKPYIIKRIRRQSLPENYKSMRGYPSNMYATLSQLGSGYAEIEDIQLNNIPAMEIEREEIVELLKGGVLL